MRVLFLNARLADRGGADRWLLGVLARCQGQVETVLAAGRRDPSLREPDVARIGRWMRLPGLERRGLERGASASAVAALERLITDVKPDVIQTNDVTDPDLLEVVAGTGRGVAMVQDHRCFCPGRGKVDADWAPCHEPLGDACHRCFDDDAYAQRLLDVTRRRLAAVGRMARVTVLSSYMAAELRATGVVAADRVVVIPPFVDGLPPGGDAVPPGADRLLFESGALPPAGDDLPKGAYHLLAGRLTEHKGVRVGLEAATRLHVGLPLVVAGDGPLDEVVARAAAQAPGKIRWEGWASRARMAQLLDGARSLWLPSLWAEPFGIVGLEALSRVVPVVATPRGGIPEWLAHEEGGLLVAPGSAGALADAADRLASDTELASRLGAAGQRRVARDFAPGPLTERLLELYREMRAT